MHSSLIRLTRTARLGVATALVFVALTLAPQVAQAQSSTLPYVQYDKVTDLGPLTTGRNSQGGFTMGPDGDLYGLAVQGGSNNFGTVYKITPSGAPSLLFSFTGGENGRFSDYAAGSLTLGSDGDFYGITSDGGAEGYGTVFKVTPSGNLTTLYTFTDQRVAYPQYTPVFGPDGDLYDSVDSAVYKYGSIFKLSPSGSYTTLYTFSNISSDGSGSGSLTVGPDGSLYGACSSGGPNNTGLIFRITLGGTFSVLHAFSALTMPEEGSGTNADGASPDQPVFGADGNLYGLTTAGGPNSTGVEYRLTMSGNFTTITSIPIATSDPNGDTLYGPITEPLILGTDGNFYGTTGAAAFQLTPTGGASVLHQFDTSYSYDTDGTYPEAPLMEADGGILYGTTDSGGAYDCGTAFSISVPSLTGLPALNVNPQSLDGGASATCTITLPSPAPAGGAVVSLTSSAAAVTVPLSVTVAAGASSASFTASTSQVTSDTLSTITATYGSESQSATLTVLSAQLQSVSVSSASVVGGASATGNAVTLNMDAYKDAVVTLTSSNPSIATVPSSVTVTAGTSSQTFTINTNSVTTTQNVTITASYNGVAQSDSIALTPSPDVPKEITITPTYTQGNSSLTGDVYLAGQATAETKVTLTSSNPAVVQVPSSVTVENGYSSRAFEGSIGQVTSTQTVTVTATANGVSQSTQVTVTPPSTKVMSLTLTHTSLTGGAASTGTVTLSSAAPSGGTTVSLSGMTSYASFPSSVVVPAGATSASFTITTSQVSSAETVGITASLNATSQEVTLTVNPFGLKSVVLTSSSIQSGTATTGNRIYLNANAPSDVTVDLTTNAKGLVNVPSSVIIKAGYSSRTFTINVGTVQNTTETFIIASYNGVEQQIPLYVTPAPAAGSLKSVVLSPTSTQGGTTTTANRVYLVGDAPANTAVSLTSSNPSVASVPSSVTVQAGYSSHPFSIVTNTVTSSQTVTITAASGSVSQTTTLTVTP